MKRATLLAGIFLSGCTAHMQVGIGADSRPVKPMDGNVAQSPSEPSFCLVALQGDHQDMVFNYFYVSEIFREFRALTTDRPDPKGCDLFVKIAVDGVSVTGVTAMEAYSAFSRTLLWKGSSTGQWGPLFGWEFLAPVLHADFQPGTPAFEKLEKDRASGHQPAVADVAALGGTSMKTSSFYGVASAYDPKGVGERPQSVSSRKTESTKFPARVPVPAPSVALKAPVRIATELDDLPVARPVRPHSHAVVIGIERYRENLPKADFSAGDAKLAAEYFKRVLGVPEENLALLSDERATKSDFEKYFERWLPNRVEAGDEVFVYFSGHGAPDAKTGDAYLVPYDADPTYIEQTGYPLKRMYEQLGKLPAKSVLVAMDSCFSGAGGRSVIAKGARPLVSVVQNEVPANITVIAASAGDQISNSYQDKGHGLFTYFLLKGMKEKGSDMKAVYDYLKPEVSRLARRDYNADQDPQWRQGR